MARSNRAGLVLLAVMVTLGARIAPAEDDLELEPAVYRFDTEPGPDEAQETSGRTCTALAIYRVARGASWLEQAMVAKTVANATARAGAADACSVLPDLLGEELPLAPPLTAHLLDWHTALAVTDAVLSGDYVISPPACAEAVSFRAEAPARQVNSPLDACRVGGLFFILPSAPAPALVAEARP
jgi:hypothetical protein